MRNFGQMFGPTMLSYELSNINSTNSSRKIRRRPCFFVFERLSPHNLHRFSSLQIAVPGENNCSLEFRAEELQWIGRYTVATPKQARTRKNNLAGDGTQLVYKSNIYIYIDIHVQGFLTSPMTWETRFFVSLVLQGWLWLWLKSQD